MVTPTNLRIRISSLLGNGPPHNSGEREKFSLPLRRASRTVPDEQAANRRLTNRRPGLTSRNLGDSGDGAHPVLCFSPSAGFSHPRNPKISRTQSALMGVREGEFLLRNFSAAKSPQPGGANRGGFEKVLGEIAGGSAGPGHRLDGERRGAPARSPLDLSESGATERREDWGDFDAGEMNS